MNSRSQDEDRLANIAGVYEELAAYNLEELPEDEETFIRLCGKVKKSSHTEPTKVSITQPLFLGSDQQFQLHR